MALPIANLNQKSFTGPEKQSLDNTLDKIAVEPGKKTGSLYSGKTFNTANFHKQASSVQEEKGVSSNSSGAAAAAFRRQPTSGLAMKKGSARNSKFLDTKD